MKRSVPAAAACLSGLLAAASCAAPPAVKVVAVPGGSRLEVGEKLVTLFRTPNGSLSPQDRAERAAERLRKLMGRGLRPSQIEVRSRTPNWDVYAANELLMVATAGEAAERHEEPRETAARWAQNLRAAIGGEGQRAEDKGQKAEGEGKSGGAGERKRDEAKADKEDGAAPELTASTVVLPVSEMRDWGIPGAVKGRVRVRVEGSAAAASLAKGDTVLRIRALAPGKSVVRLTRDGKETPLTVLVRKPAGRVVRAVECEVTGTATPASMIRRAVEERLLEAVQCEPGAVARTAGSPEGLRTLARGESATVSIPVFISGDNYIPVTTTLKAQVRNVALEPQPAQTLLYSNDPESIREYGTLYEGVVEEGGPVRLFYHHQNRMGRPVVFQVHLLNPHSEPASVQVIEGRAGPFIEPMQCGHRAGQLFMAAAAQDSGYITQVPPHGSRAIYVERIPHPETVSGIYSFRLTSGGPLVAQISTAAEPAAPEIRDDVLETAREEPHTYPSPQKEEHYEYSVGSQWTFIHMGRKAITGKTANRKLFGNYGVLYDLSVDLINPTDEERTVRVMMAPEAGWARGVFVIDGKLIEAPQLAPPAEAVLWSVKLAPKEQRRVSIQGMPVGGSSYPVSLVVR